MGGFPQSWALCIKVLFDDRGRGRGRGGGGRDLEI